MKKGYFETVTENHFKTLGEVESELRNATRRFYILLLISCGVLGAVLGPIMRAVTFTSTFILMIAGLMGVSYVTTHLYFRRYTKDLEIVAVPNSSFEHLRRLGTETKPFIFWSLSLIAVVITIGSFVLYATFGYSIFLASAIFWLIMCIPYSMAIYFRFKG